MRWHSDGEHLATGDQYGGLALWKLEEGILTPILRWKGHDKTVKALCWLGDSLASAGRDGDIAVWEGEVLLHRWSVGISSLNGLAVTPDGRNLLSVSDDRALRLWDVETQRMLSEWVGHQGWVTCVAVHPSGHYVLTGSSDANLVWWCLADGSASVWHGHIRTITAVVLSPNGEMAASSSEDGVIKLWDVASGELLTTLRGHEGVINDLHWQGNRLYSAGADFRIGVWEAAGAKSRLLGWLQGHQRPVLSVRAVPDALHVVSGGADRTLGMWSTEDAHPTAIHHAGSVRAMAFSPDGDWLASGSRDQTVWVRDTTLGQRVLRLVGHTGAVQGVAFSTGSTPELLSISTDGTARLWDLASGESIARLEAHEEPISTCAWSQDGLSFFTCGRDSVTRVWDRRTLTVTHELRGHENWVRSIAVHPDGQRLLTGSYDGTVTVWDWRAGTLLARFSAHVRPDGSPAPVTGVGVLPDGQSAVSGGLDGCLRVWDLASGTEQSCIQAHTEGLVGLVVQPYGVLSGALDRMVKHWRIEGHQLELLHTLAFSTELDSLAVLGTRVAVGDRRGHTWFLATHQEPLRLD